MIIMMKQFNGLLFGGGILLYESVTVYCSQLTVLEIDCSGRWNDLEVRDCSGRLECSGWIECSGWLERSGSGSFCRARGCATRLSVSIDPCTRLHGDEGVDERQTPGGDGA